MLKRVVGVFVALLVLAVGWAAAEETTVKGKIKTVDVEKKTVKVITDDKKEIDVVFKDNGPPFLFGPSNGKVPKGLKDDRMKEGWDVTLYFDTKDGKEVCTKFQLGKKK